MDRLDREESELRSSATAFDGGYFEGDPLDPMVASTYGLVGYMSVLHAVYLTCIKPYINKNTTVLEIGPGRGAWTKAILSRGPHHVWCVDALPAEATGFWDYVGPQKNITYNVVNDFSLSTIPNNSINYFFTFGCLCHIPADLVEVYFRNLSTKLKKGAQGFAMIADYEKANRSIDQLDRVSPLRVFETCAFSGRRFLPFKLFSRMFFGLIPPLMTSNLSMRNLDEDDTPRPGRWYHMGTKRACNMLKNCGFEIVDEDVGALHRDPIIHFHKP